MQRTTDFLGVSDVIDKVSPIQAGLAVGDVAILTSGAPLPIKAAAAIGLVQFARELF